MLFRRPLRSPFARSRESGGATTTGTMRLRARCPKRGTTRAAFAPAVVFLLLACVSVANGEGAHGNNDLVTRDVRSYHEVPYSIPLKVIGSAPTSATVHVTQGSDSPPQVMKIQGHSRWFEPYKAFHHVQLEVFDNDGFVLNHCELRFSDGKQTRAKKGPGWPRKRDALLKGLSSNSGSDESKQPQPVITMKLGPFDRSDVIVQCQNNNGGDKKITAALKVSSSTEDVTQRRIRFFAGLLLLICAPYFAELAAAYYVSGMLLGVVALLVVVVARVTQAVPGGRTVRAGGGIVAAVGAFVVPPEHISKVLEFYLSLWLAPSRLLFKAVRSGGSTGGWGSGETAEVEFEEVFSLAYALAATLSILLGAGAGAWATRQWVIDHNTGEVSDGVAVFTTISSRIIAAVLFQFSTLDVVTGGIFVALAFGALAVDNVQALLSVFTVEKTSGRSSRSPLSRRRSGSRGSYHSSDSENDEDDDDINAGRNSTMGSPGWNWLGGNGRSNGSGLRRRATSKRKPITPDTMDPEPRMPPVLLVGTGAGAVGKSPGRTPGAGLKPWRLLEAAVSPFRWRSGGRDDDSDDDFDGDALREQRAHAAAVAARTNGRTSQGRGSGKKGRNSRGKGSSNADSPRNDVPVGMAARSRGRFMTKDEYEQLRERSTDSGLDQLCGTPEFAKWMRANRNRVRLTSNDYSDED